MRLAVQGWRLLQYAVQDAWETIRKTKETLLSFLKSPGS